MPKSDVWTNQRQLVIEVTWHDALKSDGLKKMIKNTKIVYPIQRFE